MRIEWHATIDTTQRRARELVEQGDRRYDAVCADHQTAGRGRQGAQWLDAPGQSLLVSLILWDAPLPEPVGLLGVCAALATADALEAHYPDLPPLRLKYPNDLLLHGRKLGGVLAEVVEGVAVVGIGVNLAQGVFPPELAATAISVGQAGGRGVGERVSESERAALIAAIAGNLRRLADAVARRARAGIRALAGAGRHRRARLPHPRPARPAHRRRPAGSPRLPTHPAPAQRGNL
jgi:BirA family biotin operon repressor/biotin-[acetyl-CoA-carboxylase] ligase